MSSPLESVLAALLMTAAMLAEINLLRVFIRDWCEARRERKGRQFHPVQDRLPKPSNARQIPAVAIGAAALALCAPALAQAALETTSTKSLIQPATTRPDHPAAPVTLPTPAPELATSPPLDATLTLSTDRPSFSDTAGIAPVGHLQLETGYTFTFRDRDSIETQRHNGPELLARVGLIDDRFEFRISTTGYVWSRSDDGNESGFEASHGWSDVSLGFKLKLAEQDGALPRLALGAAATVGAGSEGISSRRAEPTVKLIWSYDLEKLAGERLKGFGVYGNVSASWTTSEGDRYWQGAASICGTYAITDRWGIFAEYYSVFPASKGTGPSHSIDFGTTYLLSPRVQLDARVGFGLNDDADNFLAGAGLSFLF